ALRGRCSRVESVREMGLLSDCRQFHRSHRGQRTPVLTRGSFFAQTPSRPFAARGDTMLTVERPRPSDPIVPDVDLIPDPTTDAIVVDHVSKTFAETSFLRRQPEKT